MVQTEDAITHTTVLDIFKPPPTKVLTWDPPHDYDLLDTTVNHHHPMMWVDAGKAILRSFVEKEKAAANDTAENLVLSAKQEYEKQLIPTLCSREYSFVKPPGHN